MALLTKDCLERLRDRIDLAEIISSHIELKRIGGKTKSAVVQTSEVKDITVSKSEEGSKSIEKRLEDLLIHKMNYIVYI